MSELRTNRIVPRNGMPSGASGGGIIQVVTNQITSIQTLSLLQAWQPSLITCSITPQAATNKVLVNMFGYGEGNADPHHFAYRVKKVIGADTTYIRGAAAGTRSLILGYTGDKTVNSTTSPNSFGFNNYLDSPSTTSAVTYTVEFTYQNAAGNGTFYLNRSVNDNDAAADERGMS